MSKNSFDVNIFSKKKDNYEKALKNSAYKTNLTSRGDDEQNNFSERRRGKNRSRIFYDLHPHLTWKLKRICKKEFFKLLNKYPPLSSNDL